ncbi:MAG: hypothetical protein AB1449_10325 [Chloroflexota bacterium]
MEDGPGRKPDERRRQARVPEDSIFYSRLVPILMVAMGILTVILILVAVGVLIGLVPFR